jgi:hypothetical protein
MGLRRLVFPAPFPFGAIGIPSLDDWGSCAHDLSADHMRRFILAAHSSADSAHGSGVTLGPRRTES